ncbi:MAG: AMP-binding protein, partial [Bacteroidota bacterium]
MMRLIINAHDHQARTAIIDHSGRHRYKELLDASFKIALQLLKGRSDLQEARIAFMVRPSFEYVATQWGIWRAGGIAVPIC